MEFFNRPRIQERIPLLAFLIFYLGFVLWTYRDYGCTWDEELVYQIGSRIYNDLFHGVPMDYPYPEQSYPYTLLLNFFSAPTDYGRLHLLNMLFSGLLFTALFEALLLQTRKPLASLWGPVFLFLTPSFLGSIPANPKDVPFAVLYFLSLAGIYFFEQKLPGSKFRWFVLGLLFGMTIATRVVGFTLFAVLFFFDAYALWEKRQEWKNQQWKKELVRKMLEGAGILLIALVLWRTVWPYLWTDYFKRLHDAFWFSAHFPPRFAFLFMGGLTDSLSYPWYYLPVMIGVTIPLFILFFLAAAFFYWRVGGGNRLYLLLTVALGINLGCYFWLHPSLYDGMRHFLFLLPIMACLAALGAIELLGQRSLSPAMKVLGALALCNMGTTAVEMIRLHPYEYVHYNELAGGLKGAYGRYETDYWVASMGEAVEWLKANETKDPTRLYRIYADGKPFQSRGHFSPNMVSAPSPKDADYAILMTRAGTKPTLEDEGKVIHRVERRGAPLAFVLKMR